MSFRTKPTLSLHTRCREANRAFAKMSLNDTDCIPDVEGAWLSATSRAA